MALYLIKPIVWNSLGYLGPSGDKVNTGYPAENGFGHEEWNNSDALLFEEDGQKLKAFHTEGFKKQPIDENAGAITIFMIASKGGKQFLVAVASRATSLINDEAARRTLLKKLGISEKFRNDVWSLPKVQKIYGAGGLNRFNKQWRDEAHWIPNWICPADSYIGLKTPIELDPVALTGKAALSKMFSGFQVISRHVALRIFDLVLAHNEAATAIADSWNDEAEILRDIEDIKNGVTRETMKIALIQARKGQGRFREETLGLWSKSCAVTGCGLREVLRASHIKPWKVSTNKERLDPQNGLPLVAHLDALFDKGLITFSADGSLTVSGRISASEIELLGLGKGLAQPPQGKTSSYLEWHRQFVFRN